MSASAIRPGMPPEHDAVPLVLGAAGSESALDQTDAPVGPDAPTARHPVIHFHTQTSRDAARSGSDRRLFRATLLAAVLLLAPGRSALPAAEATVSAGTNEVVAIFPDKALEQAVRRQVFAKRENSEPIIAADVADIAIIEGRGLGIKDLTGLEHCRKVALINLAGNEIENLAPLAGLPRLQSLDLSKNRIESIAPLATNTALQYLDLSFNQLRKVGPVAGLTNLATLLVSHNDLSDVSPAFGLPRLHSLHFDGNRVSRLKGIAALRRLDLLSASGNRISDLEPLVGLTDLRLLLLEDNRLRNLAPLVEMVRRDAEGERRFAPFLRLYVKGNRLDGKKAQAQLADLRSYGVRVNPTD